jgi:hypothetical protein
MFISSYNFCYYQLTRAVLLYSDRDRVGEKVLFSARNISTWMVFIILPKQVQ